MNICSYGQYILRCIYTFFYIITFLNFTISWKQFNLFTSDFLQVFLVFPWWCSWYFHDDLMVYSFKKLFYRMTSSAGSHFEVFWDSLYLRYAQTLFLKSFNSFPYKILCRSFLTITALKIFSLSDSAGWLFGETFGQYYVCMNVSWELFLFSWNFDRIFLIIIQHSLSQEQIYGGVAFCCRTFWDFLRLFWMFLSFLWVIQHFFMGFCADILSW